MSDFTSIDEQLIQLAIKEDLGVPPVDRTTDLLILHDSRLFKANIISKQTTPLIFCGTAIVKTILHQFDPHSYVESHYLDGQTVSPGECIMTCYASAQALLKAERTLLNFIRHLSAIATLTAQFVQQVAGTSMKILDTRKTTPGMRHLEKYAVHCGGGVNHRMGLYDAIMIKDTHIDLMGGLASLLEKLPLRVAQPFPVIVEVRNQEELNQVITQGLGKVDRVLLDNMSVEELTYSVKQVAQRFETESSGNITLENVANIAKTGVDYASVGMLTYGAGQVDLSMKTMVTRLEVACE